MILKKLAHMIFGFTVSSLMLSQVSQGSDWKNVGPIASGDMEAFVDYQVQSSIPARDIWHGSMPMGPSSYKNEAKPLWVNVLKKGLSKADRVHVQIINYQQRCYRGECSNMQQISERDLYFAESGRFTGELSPLTLSYQLNDGYALTRYQAYAQELVVWINGNLYKGLDGHNLRLNMQQ